MGFIIQLAIIVLMVVSMWKVFVKAGQPGWGCLIPFYNHWHPIGGTRAT